MVQWLQCRTGDRGVRDLNSAGGISFRNFGNSVYPTLPKMVSFRRDMPIHPIHAAAMFNRMRGLEGKYA